MNEKKTQNAHSIRKMNYTLNQETFLGMSPSSLQDQYYNSSKFEDK